MLPQKAQDRKTLDGVEVASADASSSLTSIRPPSQTLPPALLASVTSIRTALQTNFPTAPPHTGQRLAELLLYPKAHYKTLPSYLRALDRIVAVVSPASAFPLPNLQPNGNTASSSLLNGIKSEPSSPRPGEDVDFIGGAELTPIPWLRNGSLSQGSVSSGTEQSTQTTSAGVHNGAASDLRTESTSVIDGPHGVGSIETVTVNHLNGMPNISTTATATSPVAAAAAATGRDVNPSSASTLPVAQQQDPSQQQQGITQGELLRQEQEAGIVPVPATTGGRVTRASTAASQAAMRATGVLGPEQEDSDIDMSTGSLAEAEPEEENVHVRGPGVIGMEDMGPQAPGSGLERGIDVEGALGRRGEAAMVTAEEEPTNTRGGGGDDDTEQEAGIETKLVAEEEEDDGFEIIEKDELIGEETGTEPDLVEDVTAGET